MKKKHIKIINKWFGLLGRKIAYALQIIYLIFFAFMILFDQVMSRPDHSRFTDWQIPVCSILFVILFFIIVFFYIKKTYCGRQYFAF